MADSVVSCPGCGKRYSVPEGVPPGQFQCQDCSAVVPYGQPATGAARAAAAAPAAAAKGKRKKAAAGAGRRGADDGDGAGGRRRGAPAKKKEDATPYVLGIVAVGLLVLIIVIVSGRDGDGAQAGPGGPAAAGARAGATGLRAGDLISDVVADAPPAPAPSPATPLLPPAGASSKPAAPPEDPMAIGPGGRRRDTPKSDEDLKYEAAAHPPTGGNYGKSVDDLRALLRSDRSAVVTDLDHLPDTPDDLRREIDSLVAVIADPNAGGEFVRAQLRLIEIGRPAIPRVLAAASRLDFSKFQDMVEARDPCVVADAVDSTLRDITGVTKYTKLQFNPQGKLHVYVRVIENWYVWWLNTGFERARFSKPKENAEGDDEI